MNIFAANHSRMNICLSPDQDTLHKGNTFAEESELLKDLFNDPYLDVEIYISGHLQETLNRV